MCSREEWRLSLELWESEEKGVHPRAEEKQAKCCWENVCSLTGQWRGSVCGLCVATLGCHRNGSCVLWKRDSVCYLRKVRALLQLPMLSVVAA